MLVESTPLVVVGLLILALLTGRALNRFIPDHHLSPETRDSIKLAVGWVATMSALVLGLLVNSAKTSYDAQRNTVIQIAAKISFIDRALTAYGPESSEARAQLRVATENAIRSLWPEQLGNDAQYAPDQSGVAFYAAIQQLTPKDDTQRSLKTQALTLATQVGELRSLLSAQSQAFMSRPLLVVLVSWLLVIFLSFSVLAPRNMTAITTLVISAISIAGAIFLIVELDRPFRGLVRIPVEPMLNALANLGR
jgi:hypothetical protein